jgi:hypothetical protein
MKRNPAEEDPGLFGKCCNRAWLHMPCKRGWWKSSHQFPVGSPHRQQGLHSK